MTDLQFLNIIKETPFVTNNLMAEREIFDATETCLFDHQRHENAFCFYKDSSFNYKNMFFFVAQSALHNNKLLQWKESCFLTEIIALEKNKEQNLQITNWLSLQGIFHYRTIFRMCRHNNLPKDSLDFTLVQNPIDEDIEVIRQLLLNNFDVLSERIPTLDELKKWQKSTYIIKENHQIAALLVSEMKGTTNELHFWLVLPEFRGKGYGDLVFKYCFNCNKDIQRYTSWININHAYSIKKHIECGFFKDKLINNIYLNNNIMKEKIIKILEETRPEFDFNEEDINFISAGYLDSFDIITLVVDLENTFEIKIPGALIVPENFENTAAILKLIQNSKNAS